MNGSTIDVPTPDGVADCYISTPDGDGSHPGVLFMIDAIGLRPRIEEMADRIAAQGYLLAPRVRAEVYWGHADQDQSMTPENIATLDEAMDDAGVRHTTEVYAGAHHGYTMSDMGAYDEAAAERHFTALFALLDRAGPR